MCRYVGRRGVGRVAAWLLVGAMAACAPAKGRVAAVQAVAPPESLEVGFKRVDEWEFVELEAPLTGVEAQLQRQFERVFSNAQHSQAYLCLARELASFYEKYSALPNECLENEMLGRCGAPVSGRYSFRIYYSDGTLLDSPLSDASLSDMSQKLVEGLPPFTTFGITARPLGPNVLVMLEMASPGATIQIGEPDAARNVLVKGEIFGDFERALPVINQGEAGTASCEGDSAVAWPKYAFKCNMAAGDDEAWITLSAAAEWPAWETPLLHLPAHKAGWVPPTKYRRAPPELPAHVSTRTALLTTINGLRTRQGKRALELAAEQSTFIEPIYERMFHMSVEEDTPLRAQMLRGEHVHGDVTWARITAGIAFDGDAADWLAFHLKYPLDRATLMSDLADQIALAPHGDPAVGFGLAAVIYEVLTPDRDKALGDALAKSISKLRGGRVTERLENPPELQAVASAVAGGAEPREALNAAMLRANLAGKGARYLAGSWLPLLPDGIDSLPPPLLEPKKLAYGIVVTHVKGPNGWHIPAAVVWFEADRPAGRLTRGLGQGGAMAVALPARL